MLMAHFAAGYLLSRRCLTVYRHQPDYRVYMMIGLLASILPDLDLLYFYLLDNRQHQHHSYWSHIPFYWLWLYALLVFPVKRWAGPRTLLLLNLTLCNIMLHLLLDSVASGIKWLYPLTNYYYGVWQVPAVYDFWVLNFILHWTFIPEILIVCAALWVLLHRQPRCAGY